MIIGLGTDIVNIDRIATLWVKFGERFLDRFLTESEKKDVLGAHEKLQVNKVAKYFAAKEATVKALGTGFNYGVEWKNIEVSHDENGAPLLELSGKALERALLLSGKESFQTLISLTDDMPFAQAVVVIEKI